LALPERCVYKTSLLWEASNRWHQNGDGVSLEVAPPPEFGGPQNLWTPEHLLLAAIESCTLSTFLAYANHAKVRLVSYRSEAEAEMVREGKAYRFTSACVQVEVVVEKGKAEQAETLLRKAHSRCPVTLSLNFPVRLEVDMKEV